MAHQERCSEPTANDERHRVGEHTGVKSALLSTLVALFLMAALVPAAGASDSWCDTDPVLVITTPGGSEVPVFVNTGARGAEHILATQIAQVDYTASPTGNHKATNVTVAVLVPSDGLGGAFETRSGVSTGAFQTGTVYAQTMGYSSQTMTMRFVLPVP